MQRSLRPALGLAALPFLLSGCALTNTATPSVQTATMTLQGNVHGGQQPVSGAHIYLYEINAGGFPAGAHSLGVNTTTAADGSFSLTNQYTCDSGREVYALALSGNPGLSANNPALAEMAAVGTCPPGAQDQSTFSSSLYITINEASTVAAVYSLAGYLTGPSTLANTYTSNLADLGVTNAFSTAQTLVSLSSGQALQTTPDGTGTVPYQKINLLANVLAACINTTGPTTGTATPNACNKLFTTATSTGISTGTQPTDTITALLNIAHHPAMNIPALFGIASSTGPFQPATAIQPTDLTLSITFPDTIPVPGGKLFFYPAQPAIDGSGNVVVPNLYIVDNYNPFTLNSDGVRTQTGNANIYYGVSQQAIDPNGLAWFNDINSGQGFGTYNPVSGAIVSHNSSTIGGGYAIVSDAAGSLYVADNQNQRMDLVNNSGTVVGTASGSLGVPWTGIAVDAQGFFYLVGPSQNVLYANSTSVLNSANAYGQGDLYAITSGGLNAPRSLAIDAMGNVWVANSNNSLSEFQPTYYYTTTSGQSYQSLYLTPVATTAYTGGGLNFNGTTSNTIPIVFDGASNAWIANYNGKSISQFSNSGVALSPATTGFPTSCPTNGVAVDGSGNVWVSCDDNQNTTPIGIIKFVGLATPVDTPVLPGHFGVRP